jgi:hypothetical protein
MAYVRADTLDLTTGGPATQVMGEAGFRFHLGSMVPSIELEPNLACYSERIATVA